MNARILLVEDNPVTRKMVVYALERAGLRVAPASDGASALRAFGAGDVALVLQDLVLPDIDGFELTRQLRALPGGAEVPILAFSGLLSSHDEARLSAVGFDDVVNKPIEPSKLIDIVRSHLPDPSIDASERFGEGKRVLVVDDDPVQRKLLAFRLRKLGFEVVPAADGQEALDEAERKAPDVIVSDVLMPRLDGFGLCQSVRSHPDLSGIPVVLTTNSYVEHGDRELAVRAGASDLVLRTPELADLVRSLREAMASNPPARAPAPRAEGFEVERLHRVVRQLERQVALNAGVAQRCALLSAELAVLNGISEALATHDDIESALRHALAACFDAGGVSLGALFLQTDVGVRVIRFGGPNGWTDGELLEFFGYQAVLEDAICRNVTVSWPSAGAPSRAEREVLERARARALLLVPVTHDQDNLGALLMVSRAPEVSHLDHLMFGRAVAGQIAQALAVARAFARQRELERTARDKAAVLRSILDSLSDAVVVSDTSGTPIHRNAAAVECGLPILGTTPISDEYGLFEPDRVTQVATEDLPLSRALRGEEDEQRELFLRHPGAPDGVWLSVNARPWAEENGCVRGGVAMFRDVTREKTAQSQLLVADRMASVGMLAAGVAHEINNPLAAVLANLDLATRQLSDPRGGLGAGHELRELLDDASVAAERVRQIVRDLRVFSRHEDPGSGPVDVRRVIESTVRMAHNEIRHRAQLVIEHGDIPPVEGTESRVGQILLNLIVNAAQAIPEGNVNDHTIRVTSGLDPSGRVAIAVADTGVGIPQELAGQIFNPFFTTKDPGVGTGLGLAICHRIVTGMGGELRVESAVGKGTTFTVLLPAAESVEDSAAVPDTPTPRPVRRAQVLVIDDEALIGTVIRRALSVDHDVVCVTSALDGLARIRAGERFDVILCDLMMPRMSGMDFFAELQTTHPDVAPCVIFLTGGAFTPAARTFLATVPNHRIEKPFDTQHLRILVNDRVR